jgi:DNA repair exonuclease SbcCD nuclease subunit
MSKFIFCSDLHFRYNTPKNRIDDFFQVQIDTLKFIAKKARENEAIILIAGDLFYRPQPEKSQLLESLYFEIFKGIQIYFVYGNENHDLKNGNEENFDSNSIGVLAKFENWNYLQEVIIDNCFIKGFSFGQELKNIESESELNIFCLHKYVAIDLPDFINNGISAKYLCEKFPKVNYFVSGDNHQNFIYIHPETKQVVFNCGCITRQNIAEKEYKPSIILFDTKSRKYEQIFLPDIKDNVFREETNKQEVQERNNRIESFVELVKNQKDISFNFEDNLKKYCLENKVKDEVIKEINEIME